MGQGGKTRCSKGPDNQSVSIRNPFAQEESKFDANLRDEWVFYNKQAFADETSPDLRESDFASVQHLHTTSVHSHALEQTLLL